MVFQKGFCGPFKMTQQAKKWPACPAIGVSALQHLTLVQSFNKLDDFREFTCS